MGDPMVTLEAPPPFVVDPATKAPRIGSFRGHLPPVDLRPLGLGVAYRITHHKRWIYVAIATDTLLACVAVANLGYVANSFVFVLDHARDGLLVDRSSLGPAAVAKVGASALDPVVASYAMPGHRVRFVRAGAGYELSVAVGGAKIEAVLSDAAAPPPIGVVARVPGGILNATEKGVSLAARGTATVLGFPYDLGGGLAGYDYTHGYLARHTAWKWAFGLGRDAEGRRIGLNLVEGFIGSSECAVWIDDEVIPVGEGRFSFDASDPRRPWRVTTQDGVVDLTLTPGGVHAEHKDFKIVRSKFIQPSGLFRGTISVPGRAPIRIDRMPGVTEDQDILW